jgi:glycosyltransferase involved in cell wall biosynthesis
LAGIPGVEVVGDVADLRPFYMQALAAAVPLRTGSGTRLKILEAMAAGVPVISTSLGAEGLEVQHDRHILIADAPSGFAAAVERITTDGALRHRLAKEARKIICERYDWPAIGAQLREAYRSIGLIGADPVA